MSFICIYIYIKLELGFSPVAVVQQYNRQVTYITHKQNTKTQQQMRLLQQTHKQYIQLQQIQQKLQQI
jgi:uncharacterized membrane protein